MFARQSRWERALTPKAYKKQGRQGEAHRCALFKGVGRSPRPRQPGATGSNAYCLVQRCTTGSTPFVSPPLRASSLSRARLMDLAATRIALGRVFVSCWSILTFTTRLLTLGIFAETMEYRRIKYCRRLAARETSNYWEPEVYEIPARDLRLAKWREM